jgi:AbiU2
MDTEEALRRVKLIAPMLRRDVETAILSHAVMEAANDTIPKGMASTYSDFGGTYFAVQNSLALKLAMDLARIFDLSEGSRYPPEKQDKASIPVLAALLRSPDVQNGLEQEAANWFPGAAHFGTIGDAPPEVVEAGLKKLEEDCRSQNRDDCRNAIADFLALAGRFDVEGSEEKAALGRTRDFRNRRLAHSLFDKKLEAPPRYADLNLLLDLAKEAATSASLAVEGLSTDLGDQARRDRQNAEGYAACVLDGLQRAASNR